MRDAETFAKEVASLFNTRPRRHGREWRAPCPVHEGEGNHNPSLACWDKGPGVVRFKCMTGCDAKAIRSRLAARGVYAPGQVTMTTEQQLAAARANQERREEMTVKAWEAYSNATGPSRGDAVDRYLKSRCIDLGALPESDFETLLIADDPHNPGSPSFLSVIVDPRDLDRRRAVGVQTLSLLQDGRPRLRDGKKQRSIIGAQKGYGVVYGVKNSNSIVVAEGVETMLSAMLLLDVPLGIAALSANNVPSVAIPPHVDSVWIVADNDDAGWKAARDLGRHLNIIGLDVCEIGYGEPGSKWDANDELMKRMSS